MLINRGWDDVTDYATLLMQAFFLFHIAGPYLLDESKFFIQSFEGYPNILQIEWAVLEDVANFTLSVTLNIFEVKVREPDCPENDIADIEVM
jgi:hypothetical protein